MCGILGYMSTSRKTSKITEQVKMARRAERKQRAELDPWFGKRRRAGEHRSGQTKASASRNACRGKVSA